MDSEPESDAHPSADRHRSDRSDRRAHRLVVLTRVLVAPHALLGLLGVLGAAFVAIGSLTESSDDPMAGIGFVFAAGLAIAGLPLLVLGTVSLLAHRSRSVHCAAIAVVAWVALVVIDTIAGGPASWLVGIWVIYLPAHPALALPAVALLLSAGVGLLVRRGL